MVDTIKELKEEIAKLKAVKTREVKREKLEVEEMKLRKELKSLKLTPRQRAIQKIANKVGGAITKQARLIQDQQARERAEAVARGDEVKKTASGVTVTRKGKAPKKPDEVVTKSELRKALRQREKREIPKQLKKFAFKKKNKKAKKKKPKQTGVFGGIGGFDLPSI